MLKLVRIISLGLAFLFAVAPSVMAFSHVGINFLPMGSCTIKIASTSSNQQAEVSLGNLAAAGYRYVGGTRRASSPITAAAVGACFPSPSLVQHFTPANPQNGWAGEDYLGFTFFYGAQRYEYALSGASGTAVLSGVVTPGGAAAPHITLGTPIRQFDGKYRSSIKLTKAAGNGTAFTASDLTVQNGTATLSGSGLSYTAIVTPTVANSKHTLSVAAGGFTDAAGNANLAADPVFFFTDTIRPTVSLGPLTRQSNGTYTSAITLSEPVGHPTRFLASDIRILSVTLTLTGSGLNYIATLTPQYEGQKMTLSLAENKFSDAAGNPNTASNVVTAINDITPPTVHLSQLSRNADGTYNTTVTLSESPGNGTAFTSSDLYLERSSVVSFRLYFGREYRAVIRPAPGEPIISVTANVRAFSDAAGNLSLAGNTVTANTDVSKPVVTLGALTRQADGTYISAITLSEVAGNGTAFDVGDLITTNANVVLAGAGKNYTATLTPTPVEAIISLAVGAGGFTDAAGNGNLAASVISANTDISSPVVALGALSRQSDGTYTSVITLSEAAGNGTTFDLGDLITTNANAVLTGSGTSYTATLTPTPVESIISLAVGAGGFTDAAGNENLAASTISVNTDISPPVVTMGALVHHPNRTYTSAITLSEAAGNGTALEVGDLSTINATVVLAGSGTNYIATLTPLADGEVKLWLTANAFTDAAGNSNIASNEVSAIFDATKPTVVLSTSHSEVSFGDSITINIDFSETVIGFTPSDLSIQNAVITSLSGSGSAYVAMLKATGSGDVVISLPAGVVHDSSQNSNEASNTLNISDLTIAETQKVIRNLLHTRANSLLSNQPNLTSFLSGIGGGAFDAAVTKGLGNFNFSTNPNHPIWFQLQGSRTNEATRKSTYVFGAIGSHFTINPNLLFGAMMQFDQVDQNDGRADVRGQGWLAGPYIVAKIPEQDVYLEGRLLYGETSNEITPFGTYTDSFDTKRFLAQAKVSGILRYGDMHLTPSLQVSYTSDEQQTYTDTPGNVIPEQRIELGQLELGLKFDTPAPFYRGNGVMKLTGGVSAIGSFVSNSGNVAAVASDFDGGRARLELGLNYKAGNGAVLVINTHYDGIGATGFESYGMQVGFNMEF